MLLEVLLGGSDELDGGELEATVLEARDDGADESTLFYHQLLLYHDGSLQLTYLDAIRLDSNEATIYRSAQLPFTHAPRIFTQVKVWTWGM